ncbi:SRPBCC family protein [Halopenitus persicus]|uniref:SRPBCC family protein n=1 Tax=Halopenitus persicus TaxID=1048396 RepID=UPI000BBB07FD|nr:cyclase [Halopenitus persicus]
MPTYRRRTRIAAPLSDVWAFHSRIEGLKRLTPRWANLRIDGIDRPDAATSPNRSTANGTTGDDAMTDEQPTDDPVTHDPATELTAGTEIRLSVRPFGVGPRQQVVSRIRDRHTGSGRAYFVDDMPSGPLPEWVHTHLFFADGEDTILVDDVHYRLPCGAVTDRFAPVTDAGLELAFRDRHRRTKAALE